LAWSAVLLAFDFDGTLASIVADRGSAAMREKTLQLFDQLCQLYPCAVISGRSKSDVALRLGSASVKYIVGNHGLEPGAELDEFEKEMDIVRPLLEVALAKAPGVDIENKRYSLAVHYRKARKKRLARTLIHEAVAALPLPMRTVPGKLVVNIVPARAPNKGDALLELRAREGANTALYVGDDTTDEDVFEIDQPGRLFTIRIGESKTSAAKYFLHDQREMDTLLAKLTGLRVIGIRS
jgi:trehalose 6-phosphate phosphatase